MGHNVYRNPVIPGFHPDPSACRIGEDHYLVCSSFEYFPGVPILHSRDLANWRQIGNVLDRPSQLSLSTGTPASRGIYAPTIRHHDDQFWAITTNHGGGGNFLVTSENPRGPWSAPVWIDLPGSTRTWRGTTTATAGARPPVFARRASTRSAERCWKDRGPPGPAPACSTRSHRTCTASGTGGNPILTHSGTDLPIQSTGHSDLVSTPDGRWWLVLLGTRPRGHFPGFPVLGRETFLAPVRWEDGWPVVDRVTPTAPAPTTWHPLPQPPARDDFDEPELGVRWISPRGRTEGSWSLTERAGWLTLHATGDSLDRPGCTFIGRRVQHLDSRTSIHLDPGEARAGLSIRRDEAHHYDFEVLRDRVDVVARIGPVRQVVASRSIRPGPVTLTITTRTTDLLPPSSVRSTDEFAGVEPSGPDAIAFHVDDDPGPVAELDGRYLSTEVATGFTGRVVGMYVTEGSAAFDWFDHHP